jgi:hypothetical protein
VAGKWGGCQLRSGLAGFSTDRGRSRWLANPDDPHDIVSTEPYAYLAGRLIAAGVVNASQCPSGGLLENGWANTCGLENAQDDIEEWQNKFNEEIIAAAHDARIPAQLVKMYSPRNPVLAGSCA